MTYALLTKGNTKCFLVKIKLIKYTHKKYSIFKEKMPTSNECIDTIQGAANLALKNTLTSLDSFCA